MHQKSKNKIYMLIGIGIALVLFLGACSGSATPAPTQDVAMIQTEAAIAVVSEIT